MLRFTNASDLVAVEIKYCYVWADGEVGDLGQTLKHEKEMVNW